MKAQLTVPTKTDEVGKEIAAMIGEMQLAAFNGITPNDIKEIVESTVVSAKQGDNQARKIILQMFASPKAREQTILLKVNNSRPLSREETIFNAIKFGGKQVGFLEVKNQLSDVVEDLQLEEFDTLRKCAFPKEET